MTKTFLTALLFVVLISCKQSVNKEKNDTTTTKKETHVAFYGNYVDNNYDKRAEGLDWVAVSVKPNNNKSVLISVRSRADQKKPTCTFDTKAYKKNETDYVSTYNGKKITFHFDKENITISSEKEEDLSFFCNGGATIAATYKKVDKKLDTLQIDLTTFSKVLNLQGIGFNISSIKKNNKNTLSIFTFGLEKQNYNESFNIENEIIIDAEVEDLDSDNSPELLIYTQSLNDKKHGNVYAFSVNNKKSMSKVAFVPVTKNNKVNNDYNGNDEFSVIENSLVQRFPVYQTTENKTFLTDKTRQISYKLVKGEALKKLVINEITEF
ncbi:hypothetical protein [Tenacibaculum insulae]|uniref:hypothetical protein n=1 Tax=Tenacibaculum insulae TaxID=2029677 RepID=UPI003AB868AC